LYISGNTNSLGGNGIQGLVEACVMQQK